MMVAFWAWLKKSWEWLAGGALLILGVLLGVSIKKKPVIIAGQDPDKLEAEKAVKDKELAIDTSAAVARERLETKYEEDSAAQIRSEMDTAPSLEKDLEAANEYMRSSGNLVRGGKDGS